MCCVSEKVVTVTASFSTLVVDVEEKCFQGLEREMKLKSAA